MKEYFKSFWKFLITKRSTDKGYYCKKRDRYIYAEEASKEMEQERKVIIGAVIAAITLPIWYGLLADLLWGTIVTVGTILFCLEILIKGSGIK